MFTVISTFTDIQDSNHVYHPGDEYPRKGANPGKERIAELSGTQNKLGYPLIKAVEGKDEQLSVKPSKPAKKGGRSQKKP